MKNAMGKALASILFGATMLAQMPSAKAQQPSVQLELNNKPQGLAGDSLVRSDSRLLVTDGNWQLGLEQNRQKSYQGGGDFALIQYTKKTDSWSISPGVRFGLSERHETTTFPYAIFGKKLGEGRLTLTAGAATDHMAVVRSRYNSSRFDAGTGVKVFDWQKRTMGLEGIVGVHAKDGAEGLWLARSAGGPYAAVATMDLKDAGVLAYTRNDPEAHCSYGVVQASFSSDGKRMDSSFGTKAGFDLTRSLADQLLHPTAASTPSYLANGGKYSTEFGFKRSAKESYLQAQAGRLVKRFGPTALYAGTGAKHDSRRGWQLVAEAAYTFPYRGHTVSLELRASQHPTVSVRVTR